MLEVANAVNKEADLLQISRDAKNDIEALRAATSKALNEMENIEWKASSDEERLEEEKKIRQMDKLNGFISSEFKRILVNIYRNCFNIMGVTTASEFNVAGLGSLARGEVTPYSDVEHIILLSDAFMDSNMKSNKEAFRWVSLLFSIIMLNINETYVPCLHIPAFNDIINNNDWFFDAITPSGIANDGMIPSSCITPLGRMEQTHFKQHLLEFINTVDGMASYLSSEEVLKNGYHVASVLKTSFSLYGNEELYKRFAEKSQENIGPFEENFALCETYLEQSNVREMLRKASYSTPNNNMKNMIYRTMTFTIAAFGRCHGISNRSSSNVIDKLHYEGVMSRQQCHKYKYLIAIVCQMRLKLYDQQGKQNDNVVNEDHFKLMKTSFADQITQLVGEKAIVDIFAILNDLQLSACNRQLTDQSKLEFRFQLMNNLHLYTRIVKEWREWINTTLHSDSTLDIVLKALDELNMHGEVKKCVELLLKREPIDIHQYVKNIQRAAFRMAFTFRNEYDSIVKALLLIQNATKKVSENRDMFSGLDVWSVFYTQGQIQLLLGEFAASKQSFENAMQSVGVVLYRSVKDMFPIEVDIHLHLCMCLLCCGQVDQTITKCLETIQLLTNREKQGWHLANMHALHNTLACAYAISGDLPSAIENHETEYSAMKDIDENHPELKKVASFIQVLKDTYSTGVYENPHWKKAKLESYRDHRAPHRKQHFKNHQVHNFSHKRSKSF